MARLLLALTLAALLAAPAPAQFITFNSPGMAGVDFDTLATTGTTNSWSNGSTVNGVYAFRSDVTPAEVPSYIADPGTSTTGGLHSYGQVGNSERALGSIGSNAIGNLAYGVVMQNSSTDPLNVFLSYDGEQWRNNGNTTQHSLEFGYRTFAIAPTTAADWTPASQLPTGYADLDTLDFTGPVASASAATLNGNDPANRTMFGVTQITTVAPGEYLVLRWFDANNVGNDHALGIDNLVITAVPVPEPTGVLAAGFMVVSLLGLARRRHRGGSVR